MPGPNFHPSEPLTGIPRVAVGLLGYGWIGRAHAAALNRLLATADELVALPRLHALCGRHEEAVGTAAQRLGFAGYYTDWRDLVADPEVQALVNGAQAYLHAEPSIAALKAGKHVLCEKPLGATLAEARAMLEVARGSGLVHMTGFNYRFVPAIRLARDLIKSGALGRIYLFRGHYLQEFRRDPMFPAFGDRPEARGRGALNDIGSHLFDLARFLVGEIATVSGIARTHISRRPSPTDPSVTLDVPQEDTFHCVAEFADGPTGIFDASAIATGRKNQMSLEVNGERGSLRFNLERLNELEVYLLDEQRPEALGFRDVLVTEAVHPFAQRWWHKGHILAWEDALRHEQEHFIACVAKGVQVGPQGATFEDGYRAAAIAEAVRVSSREGRRIDVETVARG